MSNVIPLRPRPRPTAPQPPSRPPVEDVEGLTLQLLRAARDAPGSPKLQAAMLRVFGAERAAQLHDDVALIAGAVGPADPDGAVSPIETAMLHALALAQRAEAAPAGDDLGAAIARVATALTANAIQVPDQGVDDPRRPANEFHRPPTRTTLLTPPQMLLLQGVRFSAEQLLNGSEDYAELARAYDAHGLDVAAASLFGLARIIGRTAFRPVTVQCFVCPTVSADEQALIEAIGALQLDDRPTAQAILREFLPPLAAQFAAEPALGVARSFSARGYRLA